MCVSNLRGRRAPFCFSGPSSRRLDSYTLSRQSLDRVCLRLPGWRGWRAPFCFAGPSSRRFDPYPQSPVIVSITRTSCVYVYQAGVSVRERELLWTRGGTAEQQKRVSNLNRQGVGNICVTLVIAQMYICIIFCMRRIWINLAHVQKTADVLGPHKLCKKYIESTSFSVFIF